MIRILTHAYNNCNKKEVLNKKILIERHLRYIVFYWSLTNQTWDGLLLCTLIWITHSVTFWHLHWKLNGHITYLLLWGSLSRIFGAILWGFFFTINTLIFIGITTKNVHFLSPHFALTTLNCFGACKVKDV
jgi:hypothetical protein